MKDDLIKHVEQDVLNEQELSDGIQQIVIGTIMTIFSLLWLLNALEIGIVFPILFAVSPLIIKQLRKRITYPRIGYAKIKLKYKDLTIIMIIVGLTILFMFSCYTFNLKIIPRSLLTESLLFTYLAMIYAVLMVISYLKIKKILFLIHSGYVILFVSAVWLFRLSINTDLEFVFILGFSLIALIYGIFTLRAFIRKYPVLKDESR